MWINHFGFGYIGDILEILACDLPSLNVKTFIGCLNRPLR